MNDMDDLVTWLRAQLGLDDQAIERMRTEPMHGVESGAEEDYLMFANRAPAEVDAKRRILDRYEDNAVDEWPHFVIHLLALPYADRPGYREEWRP